MLAASLHIVSPQHRRIRGAELNNPDFRRPVVMIIGRNGAGRVHNAVFRQHTQHICRRALAHLETYKLLFQQQRFALATPT